MLSRFDRRGEQVVIAQQVARLLVFAHLVAV